MLRSALRPATLFRRSLAVARAEATESKAAAGTPSGKLSFRFNTPYAALYNDKPVHMVNFPAATGYMGVLANHTATLAQIKPGVVSVWQEENAEPKKFFVTGGVAVIREDNTAAITVAEALPLDHIDINQVKASLADASSAATSATDVNVKTEAQISVDVYEAMVAAIEGTK